MLLENMLLARHDVITLARNGLVFASGCSEVNEFILAMKTMSHEEAGC
jgi:hypothetical protein